MVETIVPILWQMKELPNILIIINNFAAFTETYPDKEDAIAFLSREGTKYGIYFVLTAVGTNAVRFRLLQNFKQLIAMQMNDESEYSTIVGKTDGLLPSKFKGRGLVKLDAIYEFQTAHITKEPVPFKFIQNYCIGIKLNGMVQVQGDTNPTREGRYRFPW